MRLINVGVFLGRERQITEEGAVNCDTKPVLKELDDAVTDYAILSHRWIDEVNYMEITELAKMEDRDKIRERSGYQKIVKSCQQAERDGFEWLWVDTCCIDKRNSAELSETLNSMFRWYENSKRCYAYLHDVDVFSSTPDNETFAASKGWPEWFSRGWTLQELIAPTDLQFFNKDWQPIGDKRNLAPTLQIITHVPTQVLEGGLASYRPSVAQVMSWAADRSTTRVEDRAYSLMGLLDVNMPMLYGEGKKAFLRLQQEVMRKSDDQTIFAWNPTEETPQTCGVLADDPSLFRDCYDIIQIESRELYPTLLSEQLLADLKQGSETRLSKVYLFSRLLIWRMGNFLSQRATKTNVLSAFLVYPMWSIKMRAFHAFTVTNAGIHLWLPLRRYPGSPLVLQVVLACRREGSLKPITIDMVPWRSRCYRLIGEVGCNPLPDLYQQSQLVLAYEPTGTPSGIVIDQVDGAAALLLDACTSRPGMKVAGRNTPNTRPVSVTCADVCCIMGQKSQIFAITIAFLRAFSLFVIPLTAILFLLRVFPRYSLLVAILANTSYAGLSEVSATYPFTPLCLAEAPPPGEYILSYDSEIVLLRGKEHAVTSITRGETTIPLGSLWFTRIVTLGTSIICVIMSGTLPRPPYSTPLLQPGAIGAVTVGTILIYLILSRVLEKRLRGWVLIEILRRPKLRKFGFDSRTSGVVFALLVLQAKTAAEGKVGFFQAKVDKVMDELLPMPNTRSWRKWKTIVLDRIRRKEGFVTSDWDDGTWSDMEKEILVDLFRDAHDAHQAFEKYFAESISQHQSVRQPRLAVMPTTATTPV